MAKKKVFVSYDHSEDLKYKNILRAWDANENFDFEFDQRSPNEAIDSTNASVVKQNLTKMLQQSEYLLVLIGEKSHQSSWMKWEIQKAKEKDIKLKLAAVKIKNTNITPEELLNSNTAFAFSFERDQIISALDKAKNNY